MARACSKCSAALSDSDRFCGECGGAPVELNERPENVARYEELLGEFASDGVLEDWEDEELALQRKELGVSLATHEALKAKYQPLRELLPVVLEIDQATVKEFVVGSQGVIRARVVNGGARPLRNLAVRHAVKNVTTFGEHSVRMLKPRGDSTFLVPLELRDAGQFALTVVLRCEDMSGATVYFRADQVTFRVGKDASGGPQSINVHVEANAMRVAGDPLVNIANLGNASVAGGILADARWEPRALSPITDGEWAEWERNHDGGRLAAAEQAERDAERSRIDREAAEQAAIAAIPKKINVPPTATMAEIQKAVDTVADGGTVILAAGRYEGQLVVRRTIDVKAPGATLASSSGAALKIESGAPSFHLLKVLRVGRSAAGHERDSVAVAVADGAPRFLECEFSSEVGHAVYVDGVESHPVFERCTAVSEAASAMAFVGGSGGTASDCGLRGKVSGVTVLTHANPELTRCKFRNHGMLDVKRLDSRDVGIKVDDNGRGLFIECEVNNCATGVTVDGSGSPTLRACRILGCKTGIALSKSSGAIEDVEVSKCGMGIGAVASTTAIKKVRSVGNDEHGIALVMSPKSVVEDSEFANNADAGILVGTAATFVRCLCRENRRGVVVEGGKSTFQDCKSLANKDVGISIDTSPLTSETAPSISGCEVTGTAAGPGFRIAAGCAVKFVNTRSYGNSAGNVVAEPGHTSNVDAIDVRTPVAGGPVPGGAPSFDVGAAVYFVAFNGQRIGPVNFATMQQAFWNGQLEPNTPAWREGLREWGPASAIPELAAMFRAAGR